MKTQQHCKIRLHYFDTCFSLFRNGHFRTSAISQTSLESPGSIASFGEKMNRRNSLPDSEVHYRDRKSSTGSMRDEERFGPGHSNSGNFASEEMYTSDAISVGSRKGSEPEVENSVKQLPVGIVMDRVERRVSQEDKVPVGSMVGSVPFEFSKCDYLFQVLLYNTFSGLVSKLPKKDISIAVVQYRYSTIRSHGLCLNYLKKISQTCWSSVGSIIQ